MSFPRGSFPRVALAALLSPLGSALYVLPALQAFRRSGVDDFDLMNVRGLLVAWLGMALLMSMLGFLFRYWNLTRLRHHLLLMLGVGLISMLLSMPHEIGALPVVIPVVITTALLASVTGVTFKWLAYGFDPDRPATTGWKIAGSAYVLALIINLICLMGFASGTLSTLG